MKGESAGPFRAANSLPGAGHAAGRPAGPQEFLALRLTRPGKLRWAAGVNRLLMIDAEAFHVSHPMKDRSRGPALDLMAAPALVSCKGGILKHLCWLSRSWAAPPLVGGMKRSCLVFACLCSFTQTLKIQQAKRGKQISKIPLGVGRKEQARCGGSWLNI